MKFSELLSRFSKTPQCAAVILAAGSSTRMGEDKTLMELCGKPVLVRAIEPFQYSEYVRDIVVVTAGEKLEQVARLCEQYNLDKVRRIISGGNTRAESSLAGVSAVGRNTGLIAIHDGARPFVTADIIKDAVAAAAEYKAALPGIPSTDTLKNLKDGFTSGSVDRSSIIRVQTPQVFDADLIKGALTYCVKNGIPVTDDSSAIELMAVKTRVTPGSAVNIKLTTPEDLVFARAIIEERAAV